MPLRIHKEKLFIDFSHTMIIVSWGRVQCIGFLTIFSIFLMKNEVYFKASQKSQKEHFKNTFKV
jgi:hypothetical protein